ncbi:hypothetical protein ACQPUL_00830 [Clostridium butyricum]|uniref:hypothetical protein n=1 Tax=Clostridium butyricum TaxID=1492 RepID=UPI003D34FCE6
MRNFQGEVYITNHAKEKFIKRRLMTNKTYKSNLNIYKKMLNMIFRSQLIKYVHKEDGKLHEYRKYKGVIFVCERKISQDYWKKDLVTVITVELTLEYLLELKNEGVDVKSLKIGPYIENQLAL